MNASTGSSVAAGGPASERILQTFQTEIAVLDGRTRGDDEAFALAAYLTAAEAYKSALNIRDLDLDGHAPDGRMHLHADGWVPVARKFGFRAIHPIGDEWVTVDVSEAITALMAAVHANLTAANHVVNWQ